MKKGGSEKKYIHKNIFFFLSRSLSFCLSLLLQCLLLLLLASTRVTVQSLLTFSFTLYADYITYNKNNSTKKRKKQKKTRSMVLELTVNANIFYICVFISFEMVYVILLLYSICWLLLLLLLPFVHIIECV